MDANRFDGVTRLLGQRLHRRAFPLLTGGLAAALIGLTPTSAKKKRKSPFCLNGQTVEASGKKKKKLVKQGATPGACPAPPPPPPPPPSVCTPRCGNSCGGTNGCGGTCTCAANAICSQGTCRACTVTCNDDPQTCGERLGNALANGGTVVACPGLYGGFYSLDTNVTLIGAGPGDDPATSTILDAEEISRVISISVGVNVELDSVRVTNGSATGGAKGGGIDALSGSSLQLTNCAVVGNKTDSDGGGIHVDRGTLRLIGTRVANNEAVVNGGGIDLQDVPAPSIVNSIIEGNGALDGDGGGIHITLGTETELTITGSTIRGNEASKQGGGLRIFFGRATIDSDSSIVDNEAFRTPTGTGAGGGGIRATNDARVSVNGADVSNNRPDNCSGTGITGCSG